jgi:hypothetical protein
MFDDILSVTLIHRNTRHLEPFMFSTWIYNFGYYHFLGSQLFVTIDISSVGSLKCHGVYAWPIRLGYFNLDVLDGRRPVVSYGRLQGAVRSLWMFSIHAAINLPCSIVYCVASFLEGCMHNTSRQIHFMIELVLS